MAKQNETTGAAPSTPATPGQADALQKLLEARDALGAAQAKLKQAEKDEAYYTKKLAQRKGEVLVAQQAYTAAEQAFAAPRA